MSTVRLTLGTYAATVATVAVLAGCSPSASGAGSANGSTTASAAGMTSASAVSPASIAGDATAGAGAASAGGTRAVGSACRTGDLSLQVIQGTQEQSGTGSFYIQLTNVSTRACTLYGFPGVDLTAGNGTSLGMKDNWTVKLAMSGGEKVQTLAPGAASAAYVTYATRSAAQTTGDPRAVDVRVIPPDQTTALTAKIDNLYQGDIQLPVVSRTLTVGPMDIDGVPHA